jgi:metal transporter CNNM
MEYYIIIGVLLVLSGTFSGLNLGLLSLDQFELERKVKLGNHHARKIYPLRKKGNLLLCTLLLGNVAVNSILAVFLGGIMAGAVAVTISTGLIVVFGEIVPQAYFSRYALPICSRATWLVWIFFVVLYPVTKPLAIVLDKALGGELPESFSKREFKLIAEEQTNNSESDIDTQAFGLIKAGLEFSDKLVKNIMTPRVHTAFIGHDEVLDQKTVNEIQKSGHSRLPVRSETKDQVVGYLYAKDLISIDPDDNIPVQQLMRDLVVYVSENAKLDEVLNLFRQKKVHLFVVQDEFGGVAGIVTLEDVIEEIIGQEIVDEYDQRTDMRQPAGEKVQT